MSNRVLQFGQWIGGPGTAIFLGAFPYYRQVVPVTIRTGAGDPVDLTGASLKADYRSYVLDTLSWTRETDGSVPQPNFTQTTVIGKIDNYTLITDANDLPTVVDGPGGLINTVIPANRYRGPLLPDRRENVVLTQYSLQITTGSGTASESSYGIILGLIETYEPRDVNNPLQITPGDSDIGYPQDYSLYSAITTPAGL